MTGDEIYISFSRERAEAYVFSLGDHDIKHMSKGVSILDLLNRVIWSMEADEQDLADAPYHAMREAYSKWQDSDHLKSRRAETAIPPDQAALEGGDVPDEDEVK